LIDQAGGPLGCATGLSRKDIKDVFRQRGHAEWLAYNASMYHGELSEKYQKAATRPWLLVATDPPPPPMANPMFEPNPLNETLVRDVSPTGRPGFR
jgi:hypothetical protein